MEYLAKSKPIQTVKEHTDDLLSLWKKFLRLYGAQFSKEEKAFIELAAFYHDLGKLNALFQYKIHKAAGRVYEEYVPSGDEEIPHGFLSAAYMNPEELEEQHGEDIDVVVTAIYNHHTRADFYTESDFGRYIDRYLPESYSYDKARVFYKNTDYLDLGYLITEFTNNASNQGSMTKAEAHAKWLKYIVVKGMLNKLDYAASGKNHAQIEIEPLPKGTLTNVIQNQWKVLRPVQDYMLHRKDKNLVVRAATGSGKTEAALFWLDGSKAFYTLPLKVSINAIYERISGKQSHQYQYDEDKITLLHSDLLAYYFSKQDTGHAAMEDPLVRREKAKLLAYPLTICTVDQLFWFVFKAMGSEIVPATLKYSKVIIDEIQMYSAEILAYIIYGLKIIHALGGKFAIITATFPPVLQHFLTQQEIPFEMPETPFQGEYDKRHKIAFIEAADFDDEKILEDAQDKKVLVLCNTVGKAQAVYERLKDRIDYVKLLHSRFTRKDRKQLENEIMEFSDSDETGIWISTQIVEASLDIDFDVLFTEMCPADSLLQRMGRCYRKRNYRGLSPNVYIYNTGNGLGRVYPYRDIYQFSVDDLQKYNNRYFLETEKFAYVNAVYDIARVKDTEYYKKIEACLKTLHDLSPSTIDAETAHQQFRNIQSVTVLPDKFYQNDDVQNYIEIIKEKKKYDIKTRMKAENDLLQYTLSLNANLLKAPKSKGAIDQYPIEQIKWLGIHRCRRLYDFTDLSGQGLCLEKEDKADQYF
ncbi:CRISPR-associated helicase Cas3' [Anaerosinus massiliensis]|uniref:CRISPR-associated helicase Cas3' n=1 Tax=Massilibacillus massiliensis TaxID=1806837 RepID=UPI000B2C1F07|nr:CRISPR-associated helicase Cas3' [Massilibacillus massiliensis]